MKKTYLLAPLAALAVFIGVYWNFLSGYQEREHVRQEQVRLDKEARLKAEIESRRQAIDEAVKAQAERKKIRDEKEARERVEREARFAAIDARDRAFRDQEKLARQVQRQQKDIAAENEAIARLQETKNAGLAERAFLATFVQKAEANIRDLTDVLSRIAAAEAARVAAAAAAAEAAKKNS